MVASNRETEDVRARYAVAQLAPKYKALRGACDVLVVLPLYS